MMTQKRHEKNSKGINIVYIYHFKRLLAPAAYDVELTRPKSNKHTLFVTKDLYNTASNLP